MKILITGATGFVGKHLYSALNREHDIYVLTRESSDTSDICPKNKIVFNGNIDLLNAYLREEKIEGIIHLAALYVAEHKSDQIKDLILSNVYLGTAVLEAATKAGVGWFINTGTIWQNYNVPDYSDKYCPVNLYAASKQAFVTMAKYYTETTDIRFSTLKLCDTYGANDSRRKIMDLFDRIAESGESLDMSEGHQLMDIVHIDEVIKGFKKMIEILSSPNSSYRDEYVVSSKRAISLRELAREYEQQHNVKLNIRWGARSYRKREVMRPYVGFSIV